MNRRSAILLVTLLLLFVAVGWAYARLDRARDEAMNDLTDRELVQRQLADIQKARSGTPNVTTGQLDTAELTRHLTSAAIDSGVDGNLVDKEPSDPRPLENSEFSELEMILKFEKISLPQLGAFFDRLAQADPGSRVKIVELTPSEPTVAVTTATEPKVDRSGEPERWTAILGVAYLTRTKPTRR